MPVVRIDIQSGKSTAYKRALLAGVRHAMTSALDIADERLMLRIIEAPGEDIDATEIKSDRLTIIEVSMVAGRGTGIKDSLYRALARRLGLEPGISEHDLIVVVNEPPAECFFMNGEMQCAAPRTAEASSGSAASTEARR